MRTACAVALVAGLFGTEAAHARDYWVCALRGNDSNAGTVAAPLRTLTRATAVAGAGDRIRVLPGRYSPTHGETFPIRVPAGADLIGSDARSCVIDAEFDPKSANNRATGTIVQLASKTRLAWVSVVNGARDPGNPGNQWWKFGILAQGANGHAVDLEIDHVIVDEVSRGIVVGGPGGDHDVKNVKIHDCVVQRFHVEGINSWVNKGSASGNQIWNCTVAGHVRATAPSRPQPRACLSFGASARFDVRNSVIVQADWAGIEAVASARVTSDHNCLHGGAKAGFVALRGVTKGANDLFVDPGLVLPTAIARMDFHQVGTRSPLWRKGVNFPGQGAQSDIDFRGRRLVAGTVDIGADEYDGHDVYFLEAPRIGRTVRIAMVGTPSTAAVLLLGFRALASGVTVPGFQGKLWIDPALPIVTGVTLKNASGRSGVWLVTPNVASIAGIELDLQSIDLPGRQLSDLDQARILR